MARSRRLQEVLGLAGRRYAWRGSTSPTSGPSTSWPRWWCSRAVRRARATIAVRHQHHRWPGRCGRHARGPSAPVHPRVVPSQRRTIRRSRPSRPGDGGRGQGRSWGRPSPRWPKRGWRTWCRWSPWQSARRRSSCPGARRRCASTETIRRCFCCSASATRPTASPWPSSGQEEGGSHGHLPRRTPGVGEKRKRAILQHFGSPEALPAGVARRDRGRAGAAGQGGPRLHDLRAQDGVDWNDTRQGPHRVVGAVEDDDGAGARRFWTAGARAPWRWWAVG